MLVLPTVVYLAVYWACLALGLWALVDAAIRRTDAYPAADRQTKLIWVGILAVGLFAQVAFSGILGSALGLLGLAGITAAIIYLVDVRRRLIEVTRGSRGSSGSSGSRW